MADLSSARKRQRNAGSNTSTALPTSPSIAPQSLFYPLTLHIVPEAGSGPSSEPDVDADGDAEVHSDHDRFDGNPDDITVDSRNEHLDDQSGAEDEPSPATITDYDRAVARIDTLQSHLTAGMALDLKSLLAVIHTYLAAPNPGTHPLFELIASTDISNDEIVTLAKTVESGLAAFLARGGGGAHKPKPDPGNPVATPPSEPTPATPSSSRSRVVTSGCAERDQRTCRFTGQRTGGVVAHVIPFSVRDDKAVNFWKFIAMFRGEADTAAMRSATLGTGDSTDTLRNVCWMWNSAHAAFDAGKLAVIPQLEPTQIPYNPRLVSEVPILRPTFLLRFRSDIRVC